MTQEYTPSPVVSGTATCPACGKTVRPGESYRYLSNTQVLHAGCERDERRLWTRRDEVRQSLDEVLDAAGESVTDETRQALVDRVMRLLLAR